MAREDRVGQEGPRDIGRKARRGLSQLGWQRTVVAVVLVALALFIAFNSWQLPLLRFDMGRMFTSLVGSSEENIRRAIADVLAQFGRMSSSGLVNLSHAPQGPWERVYTADTASSEISDESIEDYFRQYLVDAA